MTYCLPDCLGSPASKDFNEIDLLTNFSLKTSSAAFARSSVSALMVTPSSPDQAMLALVPRKSKRWPTSFAAWLSALSTSWRSTLLTTSNDASAMIVSPSSLGPAERRYRTDGGRSVLPGPCRLTNRRQVRPVTRSAVPGGLPEWPKGAVCKTVGSAYVGSNPTPATTPQGP